MKVLHLCPAFHDKGGGIFDVITNVVPLQSSITNLDVCATSFTNYSNLCVHNSFIKKFFSYLCFLARKIKDTDIVHLHGAYSLEFILYCFFLIRFSGKIIYQPHGLLNKTRILEKSTYKKLIANYTYQKFIIKKSSVVIACSNIEKSELENTIDTAKVVTISNGISQIFFKKPLLLDQYYVPNTLLFFSQITPIKGILELLDAVSILKQNNLILNVHIHGYGDQKYIEYLQKRAYILGIERNIVWAGPVAPECRTELYDRYSHFVLPTKYENFGLVIAEALARGVSVLTSKDTPWASEDYNDLENLTIYDRAKDNFPEALRLFMCKKLPPPKARIRSARKIATLFNWSRIVYDYADIYHEVCNEDL